MIEINQQQWDDDEKEILRENTAQAIHERLETQDNLPERYERRWIWELFQNALDASATTPDLRIKIRFDQSLVFSHNGAPFSSREILHLIFHGSTKRESTGTIGRYGTGFLTTHVLSRAVHVRGQLQTHQYFDFTLDRTGATPAQLMEAMEKSRLQLLESLSPADEHHAKTTEFEYPLSTSNSKAVVQQTLSNFANIAVAVIAFNPKIRSITLNGKINDTYELLSTETLDSNCVALRIGDPKRPDDAYNVVLAGDDHVIVLVFLQNGNNLVIASPHDVPRIFVAFPLYGTELIPFPFLINAPRGIPTEERNGLFLGAEHDREANLQNKRLIERAWEFYQTLARVAASRHWQGLHLLARFGSSPEFDWLDTPWLIEVLKTNADRVISSQNLVQTISGSLLTPSAGIFPTGLSESCFGRLHTLVKELCGNSVVDGAVASYWAQNINEWHGLSVESDLNEVTPVELTRKLASIATIGALAQELPPAGDPFDWLNRLLLLLIESNENWTDKNVLPDQTGRFSALPKLFCDRDIDEELKDVAALFGLDVRTQLLDKRVTEEVQDRLTIYDQEKLLGALLNAVRARRTIHYDSANARLLRWLIKNRRATEIKTYTFLLYDRDPKGSPCLSLLSGPILAPPETWPSTAQPFVDLFPADRILASGYTALLTNEDWQYLSSEGISVLDPLIRAPRSLDIDELPSMLQNPLAMENGDHALAPTSVSDVLFLTMKDRGIMDTARASKSRSTMVLHFFMNHVLPNALADLSYQEVTCTCGMCHQVHSAAWITPLRERKWIHESRGHATHLSASSLARLLRDEPALLHRLSEDAVLTLLSRLAVSPSELHRSALGLSDEQVTKLDKAVLKVLAASNNDPERLAQIADLVSSAPEMLDEFEERKRTRERIRKNQQLGSLVEDLFRQLFSSPEILRMGLRLRRTGIGSDFAFENDLVEDNEEHLFEITSPKKQLLVELKSTLGSTAKMTPTQATTAANNANAFALCVVPLENRTPTIDLVIASGRFVTDIGSALSAKIVEVTDFEAKKAIAARASGGIEVSITGGEVRYEILESVWTLGKSVPQFIQYLIAFFSAEDSAAEANSHSDQHPKPLN